MTALLCPPVRIGIAGWALRREHRDDFPAGTSHLARYAQKFSCVEINSSFYRPHRTQTYARWAEAVPDGFLFAVKAPKRITHEKRLKDCAAEWTQFLSEIVGLGERLGPVLIQLPPSLAHSSEVADFWELVRGRFDGPMACEPRHVSWFSAEVDAELHRYRIARVAADPALHEGAGRPGGWDRLTYTRLHGSPRVYYDRYDEAYIHALAEGLRLQAGQGRAAWCIFDNTASGWATANAFELQALLSGRGCSIR